MAGLMPPSPSGEGRGEGHEGPFFDALEVRDPEVRERDLFARLPAQIEYAQAKSAFFAKRLAGVDARAVTSRRALAALPVTRKTELLELQAGLRPFGGLEATPVSGVARIFMSPGPIYEPEGRGADPWRSARPLYAAGFRRGDLAINCFS